MRYSPAAVAAANLATAAQPITGVEKRLYLSTQPTVRVGTVNFSAPGTATFEPGALFDVGTGPGDGKHLFAVALTPIRSAAATELCLDITHSGTTAAKAKAIFRPPAQASDQSFNLPQFYARDMLVQPTASNDFTINKITGIDDTGTKGGAAGLSLALYYGPELTDFAQITCPQDVTPSMPNSPGEAFACGLDPSRWVKVSRGEAGSLELGGPYFGWAEDLARYTGFDDCTVMLEIWKQQRLLTERQVFSGYVPGGSPEQSDTDPAVFTSTGAISGVAMFQGNPVA